MMIHEFAGEERSFKLKLGQIKVLEKETNMGYYALFELLNFGKHSIEHILLILRLGLVGADMEHNAAQTLVQQTVSENPLITFMPLAQAILHDAIFGSAEVAPAAEGKPEIRENHSTSATSMAQQP